MNQADVISAIVYLIPLGLFLSAFLYFGRRQGMQAKAPSGANAIELYDQQLQQSRQMNELLERIAIALEKRAER